MKERARCPLCKRLVRHGGTHECPPPIRDWSEIDAVLLAAYAEARNGAIAAAGRAHGIPINLLKSRARVLQQNGRLPRTRRYWSAAEDAYMVRHWGRQSRRKTALKLGRTTVAVRARAAHLGILVGDGGYTQLEVAEAIGCSPNVVARWLRTGMLNGGHSARRWCISDFALHAFLTAHPGEWRRWPCPGMVWLEGIITQYHPQKVKRAA